MGQNARQGELEVKVTLNFPITWGGARLDITVRTQFQGAWGNPSPEHPPKWQTSQWLTLIRTPENKPARQMRYSGAPKDSYMKGSWGCCLLWGLTTFPNMPSKTHAPKPHPLLAAEAELSLLSD